MKQILILLLVSLFMTGCQKKQKTASEFFGYWIDEISFSNSMHIKPNGEILMYNDPYLRHDDTDEWTASSINKISVEDEADTFFLELNSERNRLRGYEMDRTQEITFRKIEESEFWSLDKPQKLNQIIWHKVQYLTASRYLSWDDVKEFTEKETALLTLQKDMNLCRIATLSTDPKETSLSIYHAYGSSAYFVFRRYLLEGIFLKMPEYIEQSKVLDIQPSKFIQSVQSVTGEENINHSYADRFSRIDHNGTGLVSYDQAPNPDIYLYYSSGELEWLGRCPWAGFNYDEILRILKVLNEAHARTTTHAEYQEATASAQKNEKEPTSR